jgi:hypothetical protein
MFLNHFEVGNIVKLSKKGMEYYASIDQHSSTFRGKVERIDGSAVTVKWSNLVTVIYYAECLELI